MSLLDQTFAALADPTRRAILAQLAEGEATVSELMVPFEISQPAISRHLKVLEKAGLISTHIDGPARPRRIEGAQLAAATEWLEQYRAVWTRNFAQLDDVLEDMKRRAKQGKPE